MWRHPTNCGGFLCAAALVVAYGPTAYAAEPEGIVVLQSGGVLHGTVSLAGERYRVNRPGSTIDVPASQVRLFAKSLEDAYEQQRKRLAHGSAEGHLRLAEWCLRYELLKPAARELKDAGRLDPRDPRLELLARRLAVARHPKVSRPTESTIAPHDVQPPQDQLPELESLVNTLPPGVVERFARKVQPLLVNSCTTSGCHQPGGQQEFQLDRAVLHGLSNRRTTLRNLAATLKLVNHDAPQLSALLTIPRRRHGDMDRIIFGPRQSEQLGQLVDWVALVTDTDQLAEPIVSSAEATPSDYDSDDEFPAPSQWLKHRPAVVDRGVVPPSLDERQPLRPQQHVQVGAALKPWQPKDVFDPEIFNRQSREVAERNAAAEPPATR